MKIGIFDPYLDDLGGGEKYMMTIAKCLSSKHTVRVFWDNKKDIETLIRRFNLDLSKVHFTRNIFGQNVSRITRLLETLKYDSIIVLSDGSIPFSLSKKLFLHIQAPILWVKLGLKERYKLNRVNGIFCNSYFTKSYVDKTFNIISSVIYPPISIHKKEIKKENIILHVGRFRVKNVALGDFKKQSIMIETFKNMAKNGLKHWQFVLAVSIKEGEKEQFNTMQDQAKGFPIQLIVNYPNDKLWDIYAKAKIYWHASGFGENLEQHPEYAEHFGISTVEAMGAGVVPVVINAGGQKEIVEDGRSGYLWNTLDELIKKTVALIENEKLLAKFSDTARKRANEFAGNRFCHDVQTLIEQ